MVKLEPKDYKKVIPYVCRADINVMFAIAVLEESAEGGVWVDNKESPASIYIKHPYGMALWYGETGKESFYASLTSYLLNRRQIRKEYEWLQVYPSSLYSKMAAILGNRLIKKDPDKPYSESVLEEEAGKVLQYERVNFKFNPDRFSLFKKSLNYEGCKVDITSEAVFNRFEGNVIPRRFWKSYEDFVKAGIGFTLLDNHLPVSTAFTSYTSKDKLEIGIETSEKYRGQGCASRVCASLIDYCMEKGFEPVWSCNSANRGSRNLAYKLGFEETLRIPYYRLPTG